MKNDFLRNKSGQPMLLMGLQANNSSTGTMQMEREIRAVQMYGGNLLEAPVYWCQIEPEQGAFDFSSVDVLISQCREAKLKLMILWFASSKNGHPTYAPDYIKLHPETYVLAKAANGAPVPSLSPHCKASWTADSLAFAQLIRHIKDVDGDTGTVVAVQVENETGLANTDRDYGTWGDLDYSKPVPEALLDIVLEDSGVACTDETNHSWKECFGRHAHEAFTAWHHAVYTEQVAAAGKKEYDLPLTVNVMVGEQGVEEAGYSYNSGAAVGRVIDIWKRGAPSIDLTCPDIYASDRDTYQRICQRYARSDNPLLIPESQVTGISNAINMFRAIANYGCIGFAGFGANYALDNQGNLLPEALPMVISMKSVMNIAPLLIKHRNTGRVHALIQEEFSKEQYIRLPAYHIHAKFISAYPLEHYGLGSRINLHADENKALLAERGRALLVQTDAHEFYLSGAGVKVDFIHRPKPNAESPFAELTSRQSGTLNFLRVEEGHFDGETWMCDYRRNGDEANFSVYVHAGQTVRIILNPNHIEETAV